MSGDPPAAGFAGLVAEVADPVRRYLWRRTDATTTEDVLAETLAVLWRRFDQVPEDRVPWAIGVARLQLRNAERASRRQGLLQARIAALDPPSPSSPGSESAAETGDAVRATLALLPVADQELLRLSAWDELTPAQIAGVLGITPNAVSIRLHRARRRFAVLWRKAEPAAGHDVTRGGRR